ncbi:MAG: glycosyltransferase [Actinomycetota bacterium]|nr:glycosyltransferase [Actinomycetota bacterium]
MPSRPLRIAWLGPLPVEGGGVPGVAMELLDGLASLGHRIDCFFPATRRELPPRLQLHANVMFISGTSEWKWNRWYSTLPIAAFASGLLARALASIRLRREILRRHAQQPYDLIYQLSNIDALAVPSSLARVVPLVLHPETHIAGELRFLIAERRLSWRCEPVYKFALVAAIMSVRALVQRLRIRRARLVICISRVFRDHLIRDYGMELAATIVVPNPVRLERFADVHPQPAQTPTVLVLGRIAVRKGIEDVVAVAKTLLERNVDARVRVVGGPSQFSDYTRLLDDLPYQNAEYAGHVSSAEVPSELSRSDILLQASRYEPFALTVAEALACGVPVVASTEVGAIEGVDRSVVGTVKPGDVSEMASAIAAMLERLKRDPASVHATARAEAARLFAPQRVCEQISVALQELVNGTPSPALRYVSPVPGRARSGTYARIRAAARRLRLQRYLLLARLPRGRGVGAEVGSWRGDFAALILRWVRPGRLFLVDPWRHSSAEGYERALYGGHADGGQQDMDRVYESVLERFKNEIDAGQVVVRREPSVGAAEAFKEGALDWVYLDGDHTYDAVRADLAAYWRVVKPGGILAGDDYGEAGWWEDGVTRAVDEFSDAHGVDLAVIGSQFLFRKPLPPAR